MATRSPPVPTSARRVPPDVVAARIRVDAIWAEIDRRAEDRPLDTGHYDDGHGFGWKAPGAQSKDGAAPTVPWWRRAWVMVIAALVAIALVGGIVAVVLGSSHHGVKNSVGNTSQAGAPVVASHIVSGKQLGNCTFKVTLDYRIVNKGSRFAGETAILRFPGSTEGIERVPVAGNGTFQASATVPGKSTGARKLHEQRPVPRDLDRRPATREQPIDVRSRKPRLAN